MSAREDHVHDEVAYHCEHETRFVQLHEEHVTDERSDEPGEDQGLRMKCFNQDSRYPSS